MKRKTDFYVVHCLADFCENSFVDRIFQTKEEAENWITNYGNDKYEYAITGECWGKEIHFCQQLQLEKKFKNIFL